MGQDHPRGGYQAKLDRAQIGAFCPAEGSAARQPTSRSSPYGKLLPFPILALNRHPTFSTPCLLYANKRQSATQQLTAYSITLLGRKQRRGNGQSERVKVFRFVVEPEIATPASNAERLWAKGDLASVTTAMPSKPPAR